MAQTEDRPGGRRARAPITREAIVDAAMDVFDNEGLDALSMRRLAVKLETGPASLYHHVANKDELLDLILDRVIGEFEIPDPDPARWKEQVMDVGRQLMDANRRHPDLVRASLGRWPMGPNALRFSDRMIGVLLAGGLPPELAARSTWLLTNLVNGFAMDNTGSLRTVGKETMPEEQAIAMAGQFFASLPPDEFPNLSSLSFELTDSDADEAFELMLQLFLDGLETRARQK